MTTSRILENRSGSGEDSTTIHFAVSGQTEGRTLVLAHGWGATGTTTTPSPVTTYAVDRS